ncbi:MAG: DUF554 domain-containing protein [Bacilli bacterium]|nr:DUF554 domain-containing protein [Bacilli bacterium]
MIATAVNGTAIVGGGLIGLFFRRYIKKDICDSVLKAVGIVVLLLGMLGSIKAALYIENNEIQMITRFDLLLIISLVLGTFIGEIIKIDYHLKRFGDYLERKLNKGVFSEGFIAASLIFCIGAMAIIGSIKAALGDPSILYLKSVIDGITAMILASTLGFGVIFAAIPVLLYQGALTGLGMICGDFMPYALVNAFSLVGYAMVAAVGLNFLIQEKIKVANMLPALILAIIIYLVFY